MSEVFEVENPRLGSRHALKLFKYDSDEQDVRARFMTEGRLLARLSHPRIVKVTDFGTDEQSGKPYFVMDLVLNERGEMQQLSDVQPGTVDEETIGRWYDDLRDGLAYIHANGVVHRDLKLQNVLIGPDGHAVLTDFGISKIFSVKGDGVKVVDTVNTIVKVREGRTLVMGSVGYMAPELEMGVSATPQSDWYALGVIVYRLLTGTWCDARTDVASALETYDPVWRRIVPRLLHSNPSGRECLSYSDEKRVAREQAEREAEERWLREKSRGRRARHAARYVGGCSAVFAAVLFWTIRSYELRIADTDHLVAQMEGKLSLPRFSDVCKVPSAGSGRDAEDLPVDGGCNALVDAWMLTHRLFDDLWNDQITKEKFLSDFEDLVNRAERDSYGLFDLNAGYVSGGDLRILRVILKNAYDELVKRLTP